MATPVKPQDFKWRNRAPLALARLRHFNATNTAVIPVVSTGTSSPEDRGPSETTVCWSEEPDKWSRLLVIRKSLGLPNEGEATKTEKA